MGATTFSTTAKGASAKEAFMEARRRALHDYGHGGYTGSIAEKNEFTLIPLPPETKPEDYVRRLIDTDDWRISDKWGPAGCIKVADDTFLFFGWAAE